MILIELSIFMKKESQNFTEKELKIVYFFITKKELLKKIFIVLLVLFNLSIYSYSIYHFSQYLAQSKDHEKMLKELASQYINYQELHKIISPIPPEIVLNKAIFLGSSKYNLVCQVINPNKNWLIESLDYKFVSSNFETKKFQSFILPEEEKILVDFNERISQFPKDIFCQIENIRWKRIKPKDYYLLEIPKKFLIKDLKHIPAKKEEERDITIFKFLNSTVYNFWQIDLIIIAYQGEEIVGVERASLKEILSGQEKEVKIIWLNKMPFVSEVKIYPEINIFDPSSFLPYKIKPAK